MLKLNINYSRYEWARKLAPFISILLGFSVGFIVLLLLGYNAFDGFEALFQGGFSGITTGNYKQLGNTLLQMTPLALTGLSIAFAFRTGLFNIGAPGQMLVGGFASVLVGVLIDLPMAIHLPLSILAAIVAGGAWALVPGLLKAKYHINEVVTSIMMNYIGLYFVQYGVKTWIPGNYVTESAAIRETASLKVDWLTTLFDGSAINLGIFIALIAAVMSWFILEKTTFGYELKACGFNVNAAEYAGMKVRRNIILSMCMAGALAGLAGLTFYTGYTDHIKIGVLPSQGFDGIAVSLLGLNAPLGVVLSAFLFGFMKIGGEFMQAMTQIPKELVDIIIATIIYFSAAALLIQNVLVKALPKEKDGGEQ